MLDRVLDQHRFRCGPLRCRTCQFRLKFGVFVVSLGNLPHMVVDLLSMGRLRWLFQRFVDAFLQDLLKLGGSRMGKTFRLDMQLLIRERARVDLNDAVPERNQRVRLIADDVV